MNTIFRYYIVLAAWLVCTSAIAQSEPESNYNTEITPLPYLSPEAASLGKYGDIPVSEYTGVPHIDIPLYTLKSGELELPVSLSYHASGIKVIQEATWVGLGWDLMAGGCINRNICGVSDTYTSMLPDDYREQFLNEAIQKDEDRPHTTHGEYHWGTYLPGSYYSPTLFSDLLEGKMQPDVFTANFCGNSISFFIDTHTKKAELIGKVSGNYHIEFSNTNGILDSWIITDNNGIEYHFGSEAKEWTPINDDGKIDVTSWFLTKIVHPIKGSIYFTFSKTCITRPIPSVYEIEREKKMGEVTCETYIKHFSPIEESNQYDNLPLEYCHPEPHISKTNAYIYKKYISKIFTDTDSLIFYCSSREDLAGESKKLDSIQIKSGIDRKIKKTIKFNYSYFESKPPHNECLYYKYFTHGNFKLKRLKLNSMVLDDKKYTFSYNPKIRN